MFNALTALNKLCLWSKMLIAIVALDDEPCLWSNVLQQQESPPWAGVSCSCGCPCQAHSKESPVCCSEEQSGTASEGSSQQDHVAPKPQAMGHKNDLIVWLQLHPAQRHVYEASTPLLYFV